MPVGGSLFVISLCFTAPISAILEESLGDNKTMRNLIDEGITRLCDRYGLDGFTIRFAICIMGSFPLNWVLKRLPDKRVNVKCFYIISIAFVYLFGVLNLADGFRTLFISSTFTYLITRFFHSSFMPHVNFVFCMGHLALNHLYAYYIVAADNSDINTQVNITSSQMVMVMKLTSFAWSYYDGTYLSKEEFETQLTKHQQDRAVKKHPSLLQFYAYVFFYPTLLTGPSFDYSDFLSWLNCTVFSDLPESKKPQNRYHTAPHREIPKSGWAAFFKVIQGAAWMVLYSILPQYINIGTVLNTKVFMSHNFFWRIHYMWLLGFVTRLKYYAAWTLAEGSCILCGLGYNGYDKKTGKIKWDRVKNIDPWGVETAKNTRECLEAWNMNTNKWLKYSVYLRVAKKGQKPGFRSTLFTFLTSAFWHGCSAGYYLTFATGALYQACGKFYRRNFRPIFLQKDGVTPRKYKWVYDYLGDYTIKLSFGYMIQPFVALNFKDSIRAWKSAYFYCHVIIMISFFMFRGPYAKQVTRFLKSLQPQEIEKQKQSKAEKEISQGAGSLGDIIKDKMEYEKQTETQTSAQYSSEDELDPLERQEMNLGIPNIDDANWDDVKDDFKKFIGEYNDWKEKKGLEIEEENLSKAFKSFRQEIADTANNAAASGRKMSFSKYSPKPVSKKED